MTDTATLSLDDVVEIASEVWSSYLGEEGGLQQHPVDLNLAMGDLVAASVSITGAWSGYVVVETSLPAARRTAGALLALPDEDLNDSDVADAIGEIANVVGGNIKSLTPPPSTLSLPIVSWGGSAMLAWPDAEDLVRADLSWQGEPITITVYTARNGSDGSSAPTRGNAS